MFDSFVLIARKKRIRIPTMSYRKREKTEYCELCRRKTPELTVHHLIPRSQHKRKAIKKRFDKVQRLTQILWVCRPCHSMIHRAASEYDLALHYHDLESIRQLPIINEYIGWIRTRPDDYMPRVRRHRKAKH